MSFPQPIDPISRIRERFNLPEAVAKHAVTIPVEYKDTETEKYAYSAVGYCYVFSGDSLKRLLDDIVRHTYDETFAMLKRRMNYEEQE